jgi:hypothetical protein
MIPLLSGDCEGSDRIRRMKRAHLATLLIVPLTQAASSPIAVSFRELVEHPAKYNGKRVSVRRR